MDYYFGTIVSGKFDAILDKVTRLLKKLILKTAEAIASTFLNKYKSELIMLARLEMCLKLKK